MKLIYIKEQKGLFASPEVKKPNKIAFNQVDVFNEFEAPDAHRLVNAYNHWLSTKIEIPEEHLHLFKDREVIKEEEGRFSVGGVEFEIIKQEYWIVNDEWNQGFTKEIAIPISNQQEGRGVEGDEVERSIEQYQRLFNAISVTNGTALQSEMDDIIRIVHEDFPINNKPKNTLNG